MRARHRIEGELEEARELRVVVAAALADREVEGIAREVREHGARVDAHLDLRLARRELVKPRHEPARAERLHDRDLHDAASRPHALGGERDGAQVPRDLAVPRAARVGEREAAAMALREGEAEVRFEHAQLLAHRRGRDGELVGRGAHGAEARDGVERTHGV